VNESSKCSFQGCDKPVVSVGICRGHYTQKYLGKTLTPLRVRRSNTDPNGRVCNVCEKFKPWSEYYGKRSQCKRCFIKAQTLVNQRAQAESPAWLAA
jgi:hypothetical protein